MKRYRIYLYVCIGLVSGWLWAAHAWSTARPDTSEMLDAGVAP